jgi:hypothetical protein
MSASAQATIELKKSYETVGTAFPDWVPKPGGSPCGFEAGEAAQALMISAEISASKTGISSSDTGDPD